MRTAYRRAKKRRTESLRQMLAEGIADKHEDVLEKQGIVAALKAYGSALKRKLLGAEEKEASTHAQQN